MTLMISNVSSMARTARPSIERFRLPAAHLLAGLMLSGVAAQAQTSAPLVLPNTLSTVAGSSNGAAGVSGFTVGAPCSPGSPYKATDIYGDGCLATQAVFGTDLQDGIRVDGQGNLWIADINNNWANTSVTLYREVDAKSGIVSLVSASTNGLCTAATATVAGEMDGQGDGCLLSKARAPKERGYGMDPYGNFFTGSYASGEVHIFCNAVSPLCPIAAGVTQTYSQAQKQVGYMYRIAGCLATGPGSGATAGSGITGGSSGDGYFASSFWNLPGDVAAWGPSNSAFAATATTTGVNGTCGATTGELNGGRSVTADVYGNVFIADGSNFRVRIVVGPATYTLPTGVVLTNPWPAVLQLYSAYSGLTAAQMYGRIYPIFGGFASTVASAACTSAPGATAVDAFGDGCPWFNTSQTQQAADPVGLIVDQTVEGGTVSGNLILNDGNGNALHVLYMGPTVSTGNITAASYPMAHAIFANNPSLSAVTHGYVYLLAGQAAGAISATPTLGTATSVSAYTRVAAGPNGNLYLGASNAGSTPAYVSFYDLSTGYMRLLVQSTPPVVTTTVYIPPATSGTYPTLYTCATPGAGDGLPAFAATATAPAGAITTTPCFNNNGTGSSQLTLAADANNNLYIGDVEIDSSGWGRTRIREVLASKLFPATIGTPFNQTMLFHGPVGTIAGATPIAASTLNFPTSEVSIGTPSCEATANADKTVDCIATVTFSPAAPGVRSGLLALSDAGTSTSSYSPMIGYASGSALATDPTSPIAAISSNLVGATAKPTGAVVDANGDVFTMDTSAGKFVEVSAAGVTTQLPGTLPAGPAQLALDQAGNLWATGSSSTTVTKLTFNGTAFAPSTVTLAGVSAPQGIAFDLVGNMYVSDKSTSSVYKFAAATLNGTTVPGLGAALSNATPPVVVATSLNVPATLAVDNLGDLFIADTGSGAIYRVDAKTGVTTGLLSSIHPGALAVDAAGDVYYQDTTALTTVEIPYAGIANGAAGPLAVTVQAAMNKPSGLAVAGNGNVYSADSGAGALTLINRSAFTYNFGNGSSGSATVNGTLTDVGNLAVTGSNTNVNTTNIVLSSSGATGCTVANGVFGAQAAGGACTFSANFVGTGTGPVTAAISYVPAVSTTGSMTYTGTLTSISGTTTTLAQIGTTVLPNTQLTLSATVASTVPLSSGETVTFLNGTTVLGQSLTNASGVATLPFKVGALGTKYQFQATFGGTPQILGSSASAVQFVTVAYTPNTLTLALSTLTTYPGQPVTLTATQTPAAVGQTITFLNNGTTTLGTATVNAQGVATLILTPTVGAIDVITANYASDNQAFASSVSQPQTLVIAPSAILFSANPNAMTIAPGQSGMLTLQITPQGGFGGVVGLACSSPVAYVTCALQFQSVAPTSNSLVTATITVAPTNGAAAGFGSGSLFGMLASLGLMGFVIRSRKRVKGLPRVVFLAAFAVCTGVALLGVAGCSGTNKGTTGTAPSGTQVVTFTSTAAGASQTATVSVLIE